MADTGNDINVQRDWDFSVNLSGLTAPKGKGGNVLPEGFFPFILTDLYVNQDKNANRVILKMEVAEGPFKGSIRTTGFNKPTSDDDKVRYYWRGLAESVGYTPVQLDSGEVTLGIGSFKGKTAYAHFIPRDEDNGRQYEDIHFLTPVEWNQQKQNFEMNAQAASPVTGGTGSALGTTEVQTPTIQAGSSNLGGENTTSKDKLMKTLGL
jgi:hypothetical protein